VKEGGEEMVCEERRRVNKEGMKWEKLRGRRENWEGNGNGNRSKGTRRR
jgi:hypothetical protein